MLPIRGNKFRIFWIGSLNKRVLKLQAIDSKFNFQQMCNTVAVTQRVKIQASLQSTVLYQNKTTLTAYQT